MSGSHVQQNATRRRGRARHVQRTTARTAPALVPAVWQIAPRIPYSTIIGWCVVVFPMIATGRCHRPSNAVNGDRGNNKGAPNNICLATERRACYGHALEKWRRIRKSAIELGARAAESAFAIYVQQCTRAWRTFAPSSPDHTRTVAQEETKVTFLQNNTNFGGGMAPGEFKQIYKSYRVETCVLRIWPTRSICERKVQNERSP